jgi:cyclopropane-fatty-acyl-phospholipid synthase
MTSKPTKTTSMTPRPTLIDRLARRQLLGRLRGLRRGSITLQDESECLELGERGELGAALHVRNPRFYRKVLLGGGLAAAAAYLRGDWECDDLTSLFRILVRNRDASNRADRSLFHLAAIWHRFLHVLRPNSKSGSRANIAAHYDLGNQFFALWLDDTLAYSSGIFPSFRSTLQEASIEKFDRVCRKLELKAGDHLLEIGTGWGGFALHAATNYGCRITTTTISQQQFDAASERICAAGLSQQITLLLEDYRSLSGRFDKLVSIEAIEAVGHRNFDTFFAKCSQLLEPDGSAVLQAIVMPDQAYADYLHSVDFIQQYVFPGGCLPSVNAMLESTGRATDLRLVHLEDFGLHYAETLRRWRGAFHDRLDEVRRLGYSEALIRLWTYYLCYCEAAFEERHTSVVQLQFDKPRCRRDALRISARAAYTPLGDHYARRPANALWGPFVGVRS